MDDITWITIRQYARKYELSENTVRKKIKNHLIQSKKQNGKIFLVDDGNITKKGMEKQLAKQLLANTTDDSASTESTGLTEKQKTDLEYAQALKEAKKLENDLKRERLKNIRQDTLVKRQKQKFTKQKYRQQFAEGVFECFTNAFSDLKSKLILMRLNKQQMQQFQTCFKKSIKKFELELKKYLNEADKKELDQNETE